MRGAGERVDDAEADEELRLLLEDVGRDDAHVPTMHHELLAHGRLGFACTGRDSEVRRLRGIGVFFNTRKGQFQYKMSLLVLEHHPITSQNSTICISCQAHDVEEQGSSNFNCSMSNSPAMVHKVGPGLCS